MRGAPKNEKESKDAPSSVCLRSVAVVCRVADCRIKRKASRRRGHFRLVGGPVYSNRDSEKVDDEGTTTGEAAVGDGRSVKSFVHRKGGERALLRLSMADGGVGANEAGARDTTASRRWAVDDARDPSWGQEQNQCGYAGIQYSMTRLRFQIFKLRFC